MSLHFRFVNANMMPHMGIWLLVGTLGIFLWALAARALTRAPLRGDVWGGLFFAAGRAYVQLVHRLRVEGRAAIPPNGPAGEPPGPLIVIGNHTAGLDPVVIQAAVPFHIRWIMAEDMRLPRLEWLWQWLRVIFVSRASRDSIGTREAIRHLRHGGVIGIFPEGGLERPSYQLLPFQAGVGLLIKRTGARVLPVIVDGTPQVDPAWASLWKPSRTRVHFKPTLDYSKSDLSPAQIAEDLRRRFMEWTGWPANDEPAALEVGAPGKSKQGRESKPPKPSKRAA